MDFFLLLAERAGRDQHVETTQDVSAALLLMRRGRSTKLTLEELADAACRSESRLKSKFREQPGIPPMEYFLRMRLNRAKEALLREGASLKEVAIDAGFSSAQHFSTIFNKSPAMWLSERRKTSSSFAPSGMADATPAPWFDANGILQGYTL